MNDLGIALVWLSVQVTAVALAGLGLSTLVARRAPGAGAALAQSTLAAAVVLAMTACIPSRAWWAWDNAIPPPRDESPPPIVTADDAQAPSEGRNEAVRPSSGGGVSAARLLTVLRDLERRSVSAPASASVWGWPTAVAGLAGIGSAYGVLRLLAGLWALRRVWRRSRPVEDDDVRRLIDELRLAQGVARPVDVRESLDLTTAATIGWRRPVLLLPADWRLWTGAQRRVVFAHELAHVARGDFAAWLLARLCVAVYFWHPLVHWLAGALQLQMELVADSSAARLCGGQSAYLRTLAELALRWDGRVRRWPAPTLFSRTGTLLRRVEMLRRTDDGFKFPASRAACRFMIVLLFALALIASGLRGPAQESLAAAPTSAAKPATTSVAPFDLSLLAEHDKNVDGVYGIRPAALLNRPGLEPVVRQMNVLIDTLTGELKANGVGIHVEDVEQVMGRLHFGGENKPGKRSLELTVNVLRTTRDMDWAKLRDQCGSKVTRHSWKGETYVSVPLPALFRSITGVEGEISLWAADARTLLLDDEDAIKALIEAKIGGTKPAAPRFAAGWDLVSRGLFAVALDNSGGRLVKRSITEEEKKEALLDPKKPEYYLTLFCQTASTVVVGFAGGDDFRFDALASTETPAAADALAGCCESFLALAKTMGAEKKTAPTDSDDAEEAALAFMQKVLERTTVRHKGSEVTIHGEVGSGLDALLSQYGKELQQGKE
jgi:beta-lactamase regulating signal transducer with metallopeptidase domain